MRPRILIAAVLAVLALGACGGNAGRDGAAAGSGAQPPGLMRVDGRRMSIDCRGRGEPTVVLDSGLGVDSATTWARVQPRAARFARVCR
jgi:hypothetical protein